jgi:AcrR family transcriptional regulator
MASEPEPASAPRRRPPLREAQREFTRRLLLEVAMEVFSANGYANTTIDDIAKAANATRATFYQYFGSKREVVAALVEAMGERGDEMFTAFCETPHTRESVRAWLEQVAAFYVEFRDVIRATHHAVADEPDLVERVAETQTRFIHVVAEHLTPAASPSPLVRATLLEAQRDMVMRWWLVEDREVGARDEILDALADAWSDALGVGSTPG